MSKEHNKDGAKTSFYNIAHCEDYDDLAEYLNLDGFSFNIGKSLFANIGNRHDGTNPKREAKKCLHYAIRRAYAEMGREETRKMMAQYMKSNKEKSHKVLIINDGYIVPKQLFSQYDLIVAFNEERYYKVLKNKLTGRFEDLSVAEFKKFTENNDTEHFNISDMRVEIC